MALPVFNHLAWKRGRASLTPELILLATYAERSPGKDSPPTGELGLVTPGDFFSLVLGRWTEAGDWAKFVAEPSITLKGIMASTRRVQGIWTLNITPVNESAAQAIEAVTRRMAVLTHAVEDVEEYGGRGQEQPDDAQRRGQLVRRLRVVRAVIAWERNRLARPKDPLGGLMLKRELLSSVKRVSYAAASQEPLAAKKGLL